MKSSSGSGSWSIPGTVSFLPKPATPAFAIVPVRRTVVLPLTVGRRGRAVGGSVGDQGHPRVQDDRRVATRVGPLNTNVQPLKFAAGAVDALPLTAVDGDR